MKKKIIALVLAAGVLSTCTSYHAYAADKQNLGQDIQSVLDKFENQDPDSFFQTLT